MLQSEWKIGELPINATPRLDVLKWFYETAMNSTNLKREFYNVADILFLSRFERCILKQI